MTCRFSDSVMPAARYRAMTSVPPPGAKGTTMRTGLTGYACACTVPAEAQVMVAATAQRPRNLSILINTGWQWGIGAYVTAKYRGAEQR
jgi:hypothetical protein